MWLSSHGVRVTSVEHDLAWVAKVSERCPGIDIRAIPGSPHGQLRSESLHPLQDELYFDDYVAEIDQIPRESLDIVIVDGKCRLACVRRGAPKVKPGGMLIVDDTDLRWFAPAKRLLPGWRKVVTSGFKPTRDLRETTFFIRPT